VKPALAALAFLFFAAHLPFLPSTLEDIDSVNFALAVRDFDVARHQPHPPGYPVFVGLSKASAALLGGAEDPQAVVRALALLSVLAGAALIPLLFALFVAIQGGDSSRASSLPGSKRYFDPPERQAWWAMGIAIAAPLYWFTALRPLSDMTGLAAAVAAQALVLSALTHPSGGNARTRLVAGAFVAALAAGIRVQTVMLTAPLLAVAMVWPREAIALRTRLMAVAAAAAGVAVWAVPVLVASGGLGGYLAALGTQAGEDFTGVVMLWTTRTPRVAVNALLYTFAWPWGSLVAGGVVVAIAAIGAARLLVRDRPALFWLAVGFGPYAVFHLLFHETLTVRYALPLVIPVAFLVVSGFALLGRRPAAALSAALVVVLLAMGTQAGRAYASAEAPPFKAMREVRAAAGGAPIAMHAVFRRTAEWEQPGPALPIVLGREWLELIERWKADPATSIVFVADPRRTDLALFDRHSRDLKGSHRWACPELPYLGGLRPGNTDWYVMRPPAWMLDRGWALSAEIGGQAARDAAGPHLQPSVAWARARAEPSLLMIGGRNLDKAGPSALTLSRSDVQIDRWEVPSGFFFRLIPIGAGALNGDGYVPLSIRASNPGTPVRVSLEQFDLQPDGIPMLGYLDGWHEPEYNPVTARAWRWMSEQAHLWLRPVGRDVVLTISGESPLRYFDSAPAVRVSVGKQEVARFAPGGDFTQEVRIPAALLDEARGTVTIQSNRSFVPAERDGAADRRQLALRIYQTAVR
jgi:hypothetical protein